MAAARPILGLLGLFFLAGAIVLQFLVILSGARSVGTPTDLVYFLQASTNNINGARNPARWTYWAICGVSGSRNTDCGAPVPALPFDPPRNFNTGNNVPGAFINTRHYYLLSRFAWVFFLIALIFSVIALLTGLLALCTRIGAYLSGLNTTIALAFQAVAAALMTAWTVQARSAFRSSGQTANLGRYAYGFSWGSVAALLLSTVLFCIGGAAGGDRTSRRRAARKEYA